jgi:hypothetical protein
MEPKVYTHVYKSPSLDPVLSKMDVVLPPVLKSSSFSLPFKFSS